jgi:hypothetical protein
VCVIKYVKFASECKNSMADENILLTKMKKVQLYSLIMYATERKGRVPCLSKNENVRRIR